MKYMGSKSKIAKFITPILLENRNNNQWFVDLFCGGCNLLESIDGKRIGNDNNPFLIAMWKGLQMDLERPYNIPKSLYDYKRQDYNVLKGIDTKIIQNVINNSNIYEKIELKPYIEYSFYDIFLIGWVGWMGSYNGRFFDGGYSGHNVNGRDYIDEQIRNTEKQIENLEDVYFFTKDYSEFDFKELCIIYCDIPYKDTKQYATSKNFDYDKFWEWCRVKSTEGHKIFISEYQAPYDFKCVWEMEVTNSLNTKKTHKPIEKLFTI